MKKLLQGLGLLLLLTGCSKDTREPSIDVPLKYCTQQYTGTTREEAVTTYNCYSYGKDGLCSFNVPTTAYYTHKEIEYHCSFRQYD